MICDVVECYEGKLGDKVVLYDSISINANLIKGKPNTLYVTMPTSYHPKHKRYRFIEGWVEVLSE